jgi:hypothetical protein
MSEYHLPEATFHKGAFEDIVATQIDTDTVESVLILSPTDEWADTIEAELATVSDVQRADSDIMQNPFRVSAVEPPAPTDTFDVTVLDNPISDPFKRDIPFRVATSVTKQGGTILYRDELSLAKSKGVEIDTIYAIQSDDLGDTVTGGIFTVTHSGSVSAGTATTTDQASLAGGFSQ